LSAILARGRIPSLLALACLLISCGGGDSDDAPATAQQEYHPAGTTIPTSGADVPGVQPFDESVMAVMRKWNVPGVTIAVAKEGKLLLARGYGYADFEAKQPTQPDSMFRIASISKVLTSLAILRLKDQGLLDLDQTFLGILTEYEVPPGGDARLRDITLRHLLRHEGGWDRAVAAEPQHEEISRALGVPTPVSSKDVIRFMMGRPLQFTPGTRSAYFNVGYNILGRVIEKVSGQTYESYVREQVLAPMGIHAMSIGQSRAAQRGPFEVKYYAYGGQPLWDSPFAGEGKVPPPYSLEMLTLDASGGWIASAIDLTRVMTTIDGSRISGFLSADSQTQLTARGPRDTGTSWYALGLEVGPTTGDYSHNGSLPGLGTSFGRRSNGYEFAILANTRPSDEARFDRELTSTILTALGAGLTGSPTDLYAQYPSPSLPARTL
jgi:CubicO group peptidase (beta-lactamase class C family)